MAVRKAGSVTGRVVGGCRDSISVEARQANRAPARTGCSLFHTSCLVFRTTPVEYSLSASVCVCVCYSFVFLSLSFTTSFSSRPLCSFYSLSFSASPSLHVPPFNGCIRGTGMHMYRPREGVAHGASVCAYEPPASEQVFTSWCV